MSPLVWYQCRRSVLSSSRRMTNFLRRVAPFSRRHADDQTATSLHPRSLSSDEREEHGYGQGESEVGIEGSKGTEAGRGEELPRYVSGLSEGGQYHAE
jgi:hypothetical protein